MSDVRINLYPQTSIDPDEPNLTAGYCFNGKELAQFGYYLNHARSGATYNLTTRVGTPGIGQGGGLYCQDAAASYWQGTTYTIGNSSFRYRLIHRQDTASTVDRIIFINGVQHWFAAPAAGTIYFTPNNGAGISIAPFSSVGRGPCCWDALYSGGTLTLLCNGRQVDQDVVAAVAPAGGVMAIGRHGEHLAVSAYAPTSSAADARASYVREFARKVLWQWQPRDVGEGPAGGILMNSSIPFGEFFCPYATVGNLKFEFVRDIKNPGLALTNSVADWSRISFPFERPFFGSFLVNLKVRNPATDDCIISFDTIRGESASTGSGAAYWIRSRQNGGVWSLELYRGGVGPTTSITLPTTLVANNEIQLLFTHRVDGEMQLHLRDPNGKWYSSTTTTDVTYLKTSYISFLPRGSYITQATYFQGEMNSSELCII